MFEPAQINYLTYGNTVPHVHTYLVLRYLDDSSPGLPLQPWVEQPVDQAQLRTRLAQLKSVLPAGAA